MKQFFLFSILITLSFSLFSQKVIDYPKCGMNTAPGLKLTKIELYDTVSVLSFRYRGNPGTWILIPGGSCIQPVGSDKRHYITRTEGISFGKSYWLDSTGTVAYQAFFPAIDPETERIDFLEDNEGGSWFIYDIWLSEYPLADVLPSELQNIWFETSGSKQMVLALYDTVAVFQGQLWAYGDMRKKGKTIQLELLTGKETRTLFLESVNEHICKMGTSRRDMVDLYDWPHDVKGFQLPGDAPYAAPIMNIGEAVFSGYIRNYTPRAGFSSGLIHVNNALVGQQESYLVTIQPNGYFTASIPMIHPEEVLLRVPSMPHTVFLEPGKETFLLVDGSSVYNGLLFQGEMAPVNNGLYEMKDISFFNYPELQDSILKMGPVEYRIYCENIRDRELLAMKDTIQKKFISEKARQVKEKGIQYRFFENLMSYSMYYRNALQKQGTENNPVRLGNIPKPETSYYTFLTPDVMNDELGMMVSIYYFFTNRLMFSDLLRDDARSISFSIPVFADYLRLKGIVLSPDEQTLVEEQKKAEEQKIDWMPFNEQYGDLRDSFLTLYRDSLRVLSKDPEFALWYDIEALVQRMGKELTPEEKEMIEAAKKLESREDILANRENTKKMKPFIDKYSTQRDAWFQEKRKEARTKALKEKLGVDGGWVVDVMIAQDKLRGIVEELTPVGEEELNALTAEIGTPFIADYIRYCNDRTIRKVAELKEKSGYAVNQTPEVDSDQLFEKMMEKFRGKVVFVDFWATWCGPCRSGMQQMKPLKEELSDKPIVFVYITNETSPEGTWKNMIAEIGGEHYRVNSDAWNVLSNRFGISGIPHYALVDKEGKVARNDGMPEWDLVAMKKLFEEFMAK
ncbi:MAG TPA: TlpA disulfide reductase family protein [Prolixibacteraceae bacterium]|nr:TlpA disulfide reductase family protein [Prolixibacteraceae bacterium]